MLKIIVLSKKC